jgi:uncharacterized FlgJ-related protein
MHTYMPTCTQPHIRTCIFARSVFPSITAANQAIIASRVLFLSKDCKVHNKDNSVASEILGFIHVYKCYKLCRVSNNELVLI